MKKHTKASEYKSLVRKLDYLKQVHEHDQDVLMRLRFAKHAIDHSKSAFKKVNRFFETERDLLGIHGQADRAAFFELCQKLKDEDPDVPELERKIETPQRTRVKFDRDDDGIILERTFHLFSGRSKEQEEHERELERQRAIDEEKQRQRENETIQEHHRVHAHSINFVGPFNTAAEHERHVKKMKRERRFRDLYAQQETRSRGRTRGRDRGFDMGR